MATSMSKVLVPLVVSSHFYFHEYRIFRKRGGPSASEAKELQPGSVYSALAPGIPPTVSLPHFHQIVSIDTR